MARIIVIDDESERRSLLGKALLAAGHEVTLSADGNEGLDHLRADGADVVVTDLFMPGLDGVETIRELRRDFPGVAVVAISGDCLAKTLLTVAENLGANVVLQKPFSIQ